MDTNQKTQVVERLRQAQNVLVTVSNDPSVDQLAAAIGLALMMNKLGKHATAVFSGAVPSTLEFLQPEETLEQGTDSLRDFIISLDKSKADKLRYKVEENVVKIFITPYRTSLSEADLNFSQGDFNVDAVVALGVDLQEHIDQAIMAHGRILHDATVIGVMAGSGTTDVGSINWVEPTASCLCEMLVSISEAFQSGLLDNQMATAFLTGIVAATDRFSNEKTTPKVMTMSAQLMAAGANQQLISNKLALPIEQPAPIPQAEPVPPETPPAPPAEEVLPPVVEQNTPAEGTIELHEEIEPPAQLPPPPAFTENTGPGEIKIDDQGTLQNAFEPPLTEAKPHTNSYAINKGPDVQPLLKYEPLESEPPTYSGYVTEPPQLGGTLTANSQPEALDPSTDPLSVIPGAPIPQLPQEHPQEKWSDPLDTVAGAGSDLPQADDQAIADITNNLPSLDDVNSSDDVVDSGNANLQANEQNPETAGTPDTDAARRAVMEAASTADYRPEPIQALNAQPLDENVALGGPPPVPPPLVPPFPAPAVSEPQDEHTNGDVARTPDLPFPSQQ